ncbi:hypothetical protein BaRGS_00025390 [Batillaria attramentaria]|uniref:CUB domain-containing protein n=1 Tax=Batillaria attramentaria TaxID=370345 RepID=A0ABD0K899_9CAEN
MTTEPGCKLQGCRTVSTLSSFARRARRSSLGGGGGAKHCRHFLRVDSTHQACGGTLTAQNGTLQSPGFPSNYSTNQNCVWVIRRPEGERITLTIEHFDLQGGTGCQNDFLEIRDGDSETSPTMAHVCDSSPPDPRRSFQNSMWIRFRSDGSVTGTGFNASYTSGVHKDEFFLITSSSRKIYRMDVETRSNIFIRIPNVYLPIAVDYDPVQGRLYWTDVALKQILSAYLNGTDFTTIRVFNPSSVPDGLAVDPLSRLLFYTDAGNDVIGMMTISGASHKTIINTNLDQPRAIVLDTMNGVMFWTDWGEPAKIERANYDGSDRRTLHSYFLALPNGLAVDLQNNLMYWVDAGTDLVECSDLDGNNRKQIFALRGHHLFGLTYHGDELFVTDWTGAGAGTNKSYLHRLNTDGSTGKTFGSVPGRLNDIHIYVEDGWQRGPNGCGSNNGGCQYFCIPTPGNASKCECPDPPTDCSDAPFDTDGTKEMTLTCDPDDPRVTSSVTWSVTCELHEGRKCVWKPQPPEDDGKMVTCEITYTDGQRGVDPPTAPPAIHGYKVGDSLQAGENLVMTCLVRGGKPLVTSVNFFCPGHLDESDIRGDSEVQSLLQIGLAAEDDGINCICTAEWKRPEMYVLSATRKLAVRASQSAPLEGSLNIGVIVGGSLGGVGFLTVIVVFIIVIIIWRRGRDKYEHPTRPVQEVELNPYARLGQPYYHGNRDPAGLENPAKEEDRLSDVYAEIEDEEDDKGGKPVDYLHPVKPADDYLHPVKPADDYLHPVKPADDYLHPVKPADDYLHPVKPADDYLHPTKPADDYQPCSSTGVGSYPANPPSDHVHPSKPPSDYLHPSSKPPNDYLHPSKPPGDYLHPSKPPGDYLHPSKPPGDYLHPSKPPSDYLHPSNPSSDYLHPSNPSSDYLHPAKP